MGPKTSYTETECIERMSWFMSISNEARTDVILILKSRGCIVPNIIYNAVPLFFQLELHYFSIKADFRQNYIVVSLTGFRIS